jgi:hypothetical protein
MFFTLFSVVTQVAFTVKEVVLSIDRLGVNVIVSCSYGCTHMDCDNVVVNCNDIHDQKWKSGGRACGLLKRVSPL